MWQCWAVSSALVSNSPLHSPPTQCIIMFSPIHFASHKIMCISRCLCPVGGQCWNTYYSLMLEPIRLQPCHARGSLRPRLGFFSMHVCVCLCGHLDMTVCASVQLANLKFLCSLCACGVFVCVCFSVEDLEGCVHTALPLAVTHSCSFQEVRRSLRVLSLPFHQTRWRAPRSPSACTRSNLPLV